MSKLRKIFIGSVMLMTVLSLSIVVAPSAGAAASAGDLIKVSGLSSVYYLGANGKRYVFPNEATYFSWYKDFSGVVTIPQSEMETYPLAANVLVRPGTKLVKSPSINTVYAVEANGTLRSIVSEANAINLWGANWAKSVIDVIDSFFVNYTIGAPLTVGQYPAGQLIKTSGSPDVYVIGTDGTARKFASETAFNANKYNMTNVVTVSSSFSMPTAGAAVNGAEDTLKDVSQGGGAGKGSVAGTGISVALASDTPAAATVPQGSVVDMLKFNITASNDGAANVTSIKLTAGGLGTATNVQNVILYVDGSRIGNAKNIDSNREAVYNLSTPLNIPAGQTKTVTVRAKIVTDTNQHNLSVLKASDITTDGATVSGSFPVVGNNMTGTSITVGALTLATDGAPTSPNLGDTGAVLAKFKLTNDNVEDITVSSITVQRSDGNSANDDFANLTLYSGGVKVASAAAGFSGKSNGYATFKLDTPMLIEKGKVKKFEVRADVIDGASRTVTVSVETPAADISGVGSVYGQSATISGSYAGDSLTIAAGAVALAKAEAPADKTRKDVKGVVFGTIKVTPNSGKALELSTLRLTLTTTGHEASGTAVTVRGLENIKVVDKSTNLSYDMSYLSGTNPKIYRNNTMDITLASGVTKEFDIKADVNTSVYSDTTYQFAVASAASTDLVLKESGNQTTVTDITPNTLTFNAVAIQASGLTLSVNPLSTALSQVLGTSNVEVINFNMKANDTDAIKVTELKFTNVGSGMSSSHISQYRLYKSGDATPIKAVSGSKIASEVITFSDLALNIPKSETVKYYVTIDIVDDSANANDTTTWELTGYTAEAVTTGDAVYDTTNDSNSDGTVATSVLRSARTVTFIGNGSLYVEMDNTNTNTNKDKYTIAGDANGAGYLAAVKLRATNEDVKITDLNVYVYGGEAASGQTGTGYTNANKVFSSVSLVDEAGTVIATTNTVSATTTFTGLNYVVTQGTKTLFVKAMTNSIGKDRVGMVDASSTLAIAGIVAKGVSSNDTLSAATTTSALGCTTAGKVCYAVGANDDMSKTLVSKKVAVLASKISNVELVDSCDGTARATAFSSGWNNVAIIKITTDANANTTSDGDDVKTVISKVLMNAVTSAGTIVSDARLKRINGVDSWSNQTATTSVLYTFGSVSTDLATDAKIAKGSSACFLVQAYAKTMNSGVGNDNTQFSLDALDGTSSTGNFGWADTSDSATATKYPLRLSKTSVDGVKILEP